MESCPISVARVLGNTIQLPIKKNGRATVGKLQSVSEWVAARVGFPFSAALGWLAAFIGVVGGSVGLLESFNANTTIREWVLAGALASFALFAIAALVYRDWQMVARERQWTDRERELLRRAQYVTVLGHQDKASRLLRDLVVYMADHQEPPGLTREVMSVARNKLQEILSLYSHVYSTLTGTRCRMCLKLMRTDQAKEVSASNIYIYALARDGVSADECNKKDARRAREKLDKLKNNSDYLKLWDENIDDGGYFFSKDLSKEKDYESSSVNFVTNVERNPNRVKENGWLLWYKSTIVWPIRRESSQELGLETEVCLGFLSVDAQPADAFIHDEHVALGRLLAYALFPILDLYIYSEQRLASAAKSETK